MAKSVKLVAENDLGVRVEIGRADLETVGSERMVILTVVNPNLIRLLGGTKVTGILTNFTEPEESEVPPETEEPQEVPQ